MRSKFNQLIHKSLFDEIDINLLSGMKCSASSKLQQNYLENLKYQTEFAFINKKFRI